ncbi:MAG TPA: hypothetical protein VM165_25060, partial [Planctomycetaceae bacterium]|nr:hypothetical protein [Planctomycetaceae bacterium]
EGSVFLARADENNVPPMPAAIGLPDGDPDNGDLINIPPYDDSDSDVWMLVGFDGAETAPTLFTGAANPTPSPFGPSNPAQPTNWLELYQRGVLRDGNRIQIPAGTGAWYTVDVRYLRRMVDYNIAPSRNHPVCLLLQQKYRSPATTGPTRFQGFGNEGPPLGPPKMVRYLLELTPGPLANQEPVLFPKNVVVHLDRCSNDPDGLLDANGNDPTSGSYTTPTRNPSLRGNRLPSTWKSSPSLTVPPNPAGFDYTPYCDILFSPRGSVTGPEASAGLIHLYVGEMKDAERDKADWATAAPGAGVNWSAPEYQEGTTASDPMGDLVQRADKLIVSIFTRTGAVTSNPLFVNGNGTENVAQRFRYSETGEVAGK